MNKIILSLLIAATLVASNADAIEESKEEVVTEAAIVYNEPEEKHYYQGTFELTFYCPCKKCCGKSPGQKGYNITSTGTYATEGRTIAVDPRVIPYGTEVYIEGFGWYVAEDTGGAIKKNKIDVYVSDHKKALQLGRQKAEVWIKK